MKFVGGETAALSRVYEYFWKKVRGYTDLYFFQTENSMLELMLVMLRVGTKPSTPYLQLTM